MIEDNDLQRLAAMAHSLRPDWPIKSITTYLHANHAKRPYRDLAVALTWIACDSSTKTPKRLEENGPWWQAAVAGDSARIATPTPPSVSDQTCRTCGLWVVRGEQHECARRADPEVAAAAKAAALANIHPTVTYDRPTEDVELPEEESDA